MRNKGDLSNFEHSVVVGARPACLTISETKAAVLWVKIHCCLEMATVTQKKNICYNHGTQKSVFECTAC